MTRTPVADTPATSRGVDARFRRARLLGVYQLGVGVPLALCPRQVAVHAAGSHGQAAPAWLVRVLGMRSLIQGVVTISRPTSTVLVVGALVDATHAASMAPLIAVAPRHRRAASLSALAAALSAAVAASFAKPVHPRQPSRSAAP